MRAYDMAHMGAAIRIESLSEYRYPQRLRAEFAHQTSYGKYGTPHTSTHQLSMTDAVASSVILFATLAAHHAPFLLRTPPLTPSLPSCPSVKRLPARLQQPNQR